MYRAVHIFRETIDYVVFVCMTMYCGEYDGHRIIIRTSSYIRKLAERMKELAIGKMNK